MKLTCSCGVPICRCVEHIANNDLPRRYDECVWPRAGLEESFVGWCEIRKCKAHLNLPALDFSVLLHRPRMKEKQKTALSARDVGIASGKSCETGWECALPLWLSCVSQRPVRPTHLRMPLCNRYRWVFQAEKLQSAFILRKYFPQSAFIRFHRVGMQYWTQHTPPLFFTMHRRFICIPPAVDKAPRLSSQKVQLRPLNFQALSYMCLKCASVKTDIHFIVR